MRLSKSLVGVKTLVLDPADNVGVMISAGIIPKGHKVALKEINPGEAVIKSGQPIGLATKKILPGEQVHTHNLKFSENISFSKDFASNSRNNFLKTCRDLPDSLFMGFARKDGRGGTRNYLVVMATSNCAASVARMIADCFRKKDLLGKVEAVIPVIHTAGCAQPAEDFERLRRTLTGWLNHPNVVGGLVVGLGCEKINPQSLKGDCLDYLTIQEAGGTQKAVVKGVKKTERLLLKLPRFKRKKLPVSQLILALQCGGSNAFSAITANPALGVAGDILVFKGGTIVLGETPECCGAERTLISRCLSEKDKKKLKNIFSWWRDYGRKQGVNMNDNLAQGNLAGGISTILEKSLGAIAKAGSSPIKQVLDYSQQITARGFVFMDTPGYDPISVTGLVAGGGNLVAFTTGRGSVYANALAPTVKISSTTDLYKKQPPDIDFNAGKVFDKASLRKTGENLYRYLIQVASGQKTKSEEQGLGITEFVPWQAGGHL